MDASDVIAAQYFRTMPSEVQIAAASAFLGTLITFQLTPARWGIDLRSRLFSTFNALLCTAVALRTVYLRWDQMLSGDLAYFNDVSDRVEWLITGWILGYLCGDAVLGLTHPGLFNGEMWLHHGIGIVSSFFGLVLQPPKGIGILTTYLLNEASTPFVNLHHLLHDKNVNDWRRAANGAGMWLSFLVFRIILNSVSSRALFLMAFNPASTAICAAAPVHYWAIALQLPLISTLNIVWFYKITLGLLKAVGLVKSKHAAGKKE